MSTTLASILVTLTPLLLNALGALRLPSGDHPAVAERWLAFNARALLLSATGAMVGFTLAELPVWVWLPWYAGYLISLRPARRRVLGESAPVHRALLFQARITAVLAGYFLALAFVPMIAHATDDLRAAIGASVICTVLLSVYSARFARTAPRLLGARPLDDPRLTPLFAQVLARARCAAPAIYRAGEPGIVFANAIALPSARTPAVVFFDTLLANLEPAETAAVFAHEVAHLEHHDRARLRRAALANALLLAVAAAWAPAARAWMGELAALAVCTWALAVIAGYMLRAARQQRHEGESDLRALELFPDGEALISGLTKVNTLNRMPRRLLARTESAASHPSLARRIRAIRAHMGTPPSEPPALQSVIVADARAPGRLAILDADRIHWLDGVPDGMSSSAAALRDAARKVESVPYAELAELLVRAGPFRTRLCATTRDLKSHVLTIAPADVARVQAALDRVDARLPSLPPRRALRGRLAALCGLSLIAQAALAAGAGSAVAWIALLGLARPSRTLLAGLCAAALATLALALVWTPERSHGAGLIAALALAALATAALAFTAMRAQPAAASSALSVRVGLVLLALPALGCWSAQALFAGSALELHEAVRAMGNAAVLSLALAGAAFSARPASLRALGVLALALGLAQVGAGSDAFRTRIADEPLTARGPRFTSAIWRASTVHVADVDPAAFELRISPSGSALAFGLADRDAISDEAYDRPARFSFGARGGPLRTLAASAFEFIDDRRALALIPDQPSGFTLALVSIDGDARQVVAQESELEAIALVVDPDSARFTIAAYGPRATDLVRVSGAAYDTNVELTRWAAMPRRSYPVQPAAVADSLLAVRSEYRPMHPLLASLRATVLERIPSFPTELIAVARGEQTTLARTRARVSCIADTADGARHVCAVSSGGRDELWELHTRSRSLRALGSADVRYMLDQLRGDELLCRWGRLAYLRLDRRRMFVLAAEDERECTRDVALGRDHVAVLSGCGSEAQVRLLSKPELDAAAGTLAHR